MARWLPGFVLLSGLLALALLSPHAPETTGAAQSTETKPSPAELPDQTTLPEVAIKPLNQRTGEFVLNTGIKDVLESLILNANSTDPRVILQVGEQYCQQQQLTTSGCQDFMQLLQTYLDYKLALMQLEPEQGVVKSDLTALKNQLQALESLRRAFFNDAEYESLFAEEQRHDEQALTRREIALAPTMTKQQKQQLIRENLENLPEQQRKAFQPTLQMQQLDDIKKQHSDNYVRLQEVESQFGTEAAQRLAKTWQQQANFNDKVKSLASDYHALNNEKEQMLLLSRHFSDNELRRAKVLLKHGQY
ncbi:lipase secretion chaperone [Planctobacterium marinum]|uniref:Lipase chaperone n=1 Tax=Planctobacterium marinum TaxID=1631968 RepID=A0AA48HP44_9ALTE|nr:hypothetical protein MACH26_38870 [Planctobacterium marinum]